MAAKLLDLFLSVKTTNWRMNDADSAAADDEFGKVRKSALERDKHCCRFCGFKANKWQEVHHFNDDHSDNRLENLITACTFCHMCQHIGLAGRNKEAVLIWLPEISQSDLHHLVRTGLVATRTTEHIKNVSRASPAVIKAYREASDTAKSMMACFLDRQAEVEKLFGTSDPMEIGNAMLLLPDEIYAKRRDFLAGIRLLPLGRRYQGTEDVMAKQIDSWSEAGGPYIMLKPNAWVGLMKSVLG